MVCIKSRAVRKMPLLGERFVRKSESEHERQDASDIDGVGEVK